MEKKRNNAADERTEALALSLESAGMDKFSIGCFLKMLAEDGSTAGQIKLLRRLRLDVLEDIHKRQQSLDLIDYIIYKIRQGTL